MVNNYDLEWELLKKSNLTSRAPKTIFGYKGHLYGCEDCECGCKTDSK